MKYWTLESWGPDVPPENAVDIIDRANEMIDKFAETAQNEMDISDYANALWERYCMTGTIE